MNRLHAAQSRKTIAMTSRIGGMAALENGRPSVFMHAAPIGSRDEQATQRHLHVYWLYLESRCNNRIKYAFRLASEYLVLSVLLWGSECWKLTIRPVQCPQAGDLPEQMSPEDSRDICFIPNEELLRQTDTTSSNTTVQKQRWIWLMHVCRMCPGA